jgi:hypothetical protein
MGQDCQPRKKSAMIMHALIVGGMVCVALFALVAGLHYGSAGHAAPLWLGAIIEPPDSQAGHLSIPGR